MASNRKAFSSMEIVVSVVVLAFAVVPLLMMFTSGRKTAALTEYHILAQIRSNRILASFECFPYSVLKDLSPGDDGGLVVPLPPDDAAFPPEYRKKVQYYDEHVTFKELKPGLGMISVTITWLLYDGKKREYRAQRFVSDESLSLSDRYPLRQVGR